MPPSSYDVDAVTERPGPHDVHDVRVQEDGRGGEDEGGHPEAVPQVLGLEGVAGVQVHQGDEVRSGGEDGASI